ncbi:NAD(P)-binding protein [Corynespora cassiicola Philippines]|uniref:NAD(P)-binding protein n=1 Tax=Corynespora cassiicola Philippines TaxID=1448308 RepID=A0A2T2N210_CORCC|nr:NAD(P)-binding protein [Corynespora cassiicola Philippines]
MSVRLTHPEWNQETGGLDVAKAFSEHVHGKHVLVTGVSPESIGSSTALSIASQGPGLLILASRTQSKLDAVVHSIRSAYPNTRVETVLLDLMSQSAVGQTASDVGKLTDRLDVVINNAGIMSPKRLWTAEHIEGQFGSNHIGHFLLTNLLLPQLLKSARLNTRGSTRVINLTSLGHRLSPIRFHDYNLEGKEVPSSEMHAALPPMFQQGADDGYNPYIAYGQSKTANILFSLSLTQQLEAQGIVSYAVHPGSIWTGLSRDLDADGEEAIRKTSPFWKDHDQGAATTLVAALDPVLNEPKGILLHDCQIVEAAPHAKDAELAGKLWELSEKLVRRSFKL